MIYVIVAGSSKDASDVSVCLKEQAVIAGVSDIAYSSSWMHHGKSPLFEVLGRESCLQAALRETRMVLFGAVRELLERTGTLRVHGPIEYADFLWAKDGCNVSAYFNVF